MRYKTRDCVNAFVSEATKENGLKTEKAVNVSIYNNQLYCH